LGFHSFDFFSQTEDYLLFFAVSFPYFVDYFFAKDFRVVFQLFLFFIEGSRLFFQSSFVFRQLLVFGGFACYRLPDFVLGEFVIVEP
jgi:hypothetical protein